jgi:hypothetical protein
MRGIIIVAAACALAACATPYRPPREPAPPLWSGEVGLGPVEGSSPRAGSGEIGVGGVVFERDLGYLRTGAITADVAYRSPYGREIVIPAGTPVFGQQYSLMVTSTLNGVPVGETRNANAGNDPIEWCTPPHGGKGVCIFGTGPDSAHFIDTVGDTPLAIRMTGATGMSGPLPAIVEGPTDLGSPIVQHVVVGALDAEGVTLRAVVMDGDRLADEGTPYRRSWDAGGQAMAVLDGVGFRITVVDEEAGVPTRVRAELLEPGSYVTVDESAAGAAR